MELFRNKDYEQTLRVLRKLSRQKEDQHAKIRHNTALTEYELSSCTNPSVLIEKLGKYIAEVDALPQRDESSQDERPDASIMKYNQASLLYQMKRYKTASDVLEGVFAKVDQIDSILGVRLCFLMLDVYISTKQTGKAQRVINHLSLQKTYQRFVKETKTASSADQVVSRANTDRSSSKESDHADYMASQKYRALCVSSRNGCMSPTQFKFSLHMYKTKVYLLNHHYKSAKKESKAGLDLYALFGDGGSDLDMSQEDLVPTRKTDHKSGNSDEEYQLDGYHMASALYLKSNLEYMRANYRKAIKLMNRAQLSPQVNHATVLSL